MVRFHIPEDFVVCDDYAEMISAVLKTANVPFCTICTLKEVDVLMEQFIDSLSCKARRCIITAYNGENKTPLRSIKVRYWHRVYSKSRLKRVRGCGKVTLKEIETALNRLGYTWE